MITIFFNIMIIWIIRMTRRNKIRISHSETHKLLLLLTNCCLTSMDINGILHVVVVLRKLAMPVAGGVPCVDSTFLFSIMVPYFLFQKFNIISCIIKHVPWQSDWFCNFNPTVFRFPIRQISNFQPDCFCNIIPL